MATLLNFVILKENPEYSLDLLATVTLWRNNGYL